MKSIERSIARVGLCAIFWGMSCSCSLVRNGNNPSVPCEYVMVRSVTVGKLKSISLTVRSGTLTKSCIDASIKTFVSYDNGYYGLAMRIDDGYGYEYSGFRTHQPPRITQPNLATAAAKARFSIASFFRVNWEDELVWIDRGGLALKVLVHGDTSPHEVKSTTKSRYWLQSLSVYPAGVAWRQTPSIDWYIRGEALPTEQQMREINTWLVNNCGLENAVFEGRVFLRLDSNFQMHGGPSFDLAKPFESKDEQSIWDSDYWECRLNSDGQRIDAQCKLAATKSIPGLIRGDQ